MDLGSVGVWWSGSLAGFGLDADTAGALEDLGYGAIWSSGGFERTLSPRFAELLAATNRLVVASGVVSIWASPPDDLAREVAELHARYPGRFLLGLGVSHAVLAEGYEHPYSHLVTYLDSLDAATPPVLSSDRVLAALGPKTLELSARRSQGAHPYFVPVEHTRQARTILGPEAMLAPELTAVIESDPHLARERARSFTTGYLALPNYANNLRRLGFGEADLADGGSDRLVDAVVAWGGVQAVADRVRAHHDAGANHVCVQIIPADDGFPWVEYQALANVLL